MSPTPTAASMGSAKWSKKRKPIATPPAESEETVYDTTTTMESGEKSEETVYDTDTAADVESSEEAQEPEQQQGAGDEEPVEAANQDEEQETGANVESLEVGYCVVPSEKRFLVLYAFLKRNLCKKVMVLFSSTSSVKFHTELLSSLQLECATISNFCTSQRGILFCTHVAPQGLDLSDVHYIVQYDPPNEPQDYVHNVEHTARPGKGSVILFLLPQELDFLNYLTAANIRVTEYVFNNKNVPNLQANYEKIVGENYFLHQLAQEAYRSYIVAYNSLTMNETFNFHGLNLKDVAASFFIKNPPKVNIDPESSATRKVVGDGKRHRIATRKVVGGGKRHRINTTA